jgi:hypothetical protein
MLLARVHLEGRLCKRENGIVTSPLGLPSVTFSRNPSMMTKISYSGYRFPPEIIQQAIWLYVRFTLSFHDVEDLRPLRRIPEMPHSASDGRLRFQSGRWKAVQAHVYEFTP